MGDGEAFQQIRKGRIEGHPLRERNISRKEKGAKDKRKICEWKKDKVNVEKVREECRGRKTEEKRKMVKREKEGIRARKAREEYKQEGKREKG